MGELTLISMLVGIIVPVVSASWVVATMNTKTKILTEQFQRLQTEFDNDRNSRPVAQCRLEFMKRGDQ